MPLDLLELLARERARLAQHLRIDADLVDVVQQSAVPRVARFDRRTAQRFRHGPAVLGQAPEVLVRIRVPGLDGSCEGEDDVLGALELIGHVLDAQQ